MGSGLGGQLLKAAYGGETVRPATHSEQAKQARVERRVLDSYQGIIIVSAETPFRGNYKATYYCRGEGEEFRRDVGRKKTELGAVVEDSRWLEKPVIWEEITAIGKEMLGKMWGTK